MRGTLRGRWRATVRVMDTDLPQWRVGIGRTPLQPLALLADVLGVGRLTVKREDLSGVGPGGAAARKLRFLLHEAIWSDADRIVSYGSVQSASCAQLCAAAGGMPVELFLAGVPSLQPTGNYLAMSRSSAQLYVSDVPLDEVERKAECRMVELRAKGKNPYLVPLGATTPLSVAGYSQIVEEIAGEIEPDVVYVAAASLGTLAGLIIGCWRLELPWKIEGICVASPVARARPRLETLLETTRSRYFPEVRQRDNFRLRDEFLGEGEGRATPVSERVADEIVEYEGLYLDDGYASKAFSAIFRDALDGKLREKDVLFVHGGGLGDYFSVPRRSRTNARNAAPMP